MSTMNACVLHGVGEALKFEEVPRPQAKPGEALVKLKAAALNRRDFWIQKGQYAGLKFPIILGSDGAGIVEEVGSHQDETWVGREVVINPSLGWGDDPRAQSQDTFRILGLPDDGTLAEYVKVPVANLFPKPEHLSWPEAAALPLAALTAYRAVVTQGQMKAGQRVLVTGAGGGAAGFALQIASALGGRVFVTSGSDDKIDAARKLGAAGGANYHAEDWGEQLTAQASGGFDLIIDSAGGDGFAQLIEIANPGGRLVFFGATRGNPPGLDMRRVFWKQLTLQGTTMGTPDEFGAMLRLFADKSLRPVIDQIFPWTEVNAALGRMESSSQFGKLVVTMGDDSTD